MHYITLKTDDKHVFYDFNSAFWGACLGVFWGVFGFFGSIIRVFWKVVWGEAIRDTL